MSNLATPNLLSKKSCVEAVCVSVTARDLSAIARPTSTFRGNGGANRDRTDDLKLAKLALSQLSYGPVVVEILVGLGRLELPTSRLSSARSNQLSYKPDEASSAAHGLVSMHATEKGRET